MLLCQCKGLATRQNSRQDGTLLVKLAILFHLLLFLNALLTIMNWQ